MTDLVEYDNGSDTLSVAMSSIRKRAVSRGSLRLSGSVGASRTSSVRSYTTVPRQLDGLMESGLPPLGSEGSGFTPAAPTKGKPIRSQALVRRALVPPAPPSNNNSNNSNHHHNNNNINKDGDAAASVAGSSCAASVQDDNNSHVDSVGPSSPVNGLNRIRPSGVSVRTPSVSRPVRVSSNINNISNSSNFPGLPHSPNISSVHPASSNPGSPAISGISAIRSSLQTAAQSRIPTMSSPILSQHHQQQQQQQQQYLGQHQHQNQHNLNNSNLNNINNNNNNNNNSEELLNRLTPAEKAANDRGAGRPDDPEILKQMMAQFPNFVAEDYLIVRQLYKSSASHVYLAIRRSDEQSLVLKFLKAHSKVRHEIRALNAVQGLPGTVQLLSVLKTEDEIVLIMQEVRAKSRHFNPESLQQLKRYMRQLMETLSRLHSLGIIHRDIKESNALMADRVVVIDFGLAVLGSTCVGQAGTKGYIAPELQIKGGVGTNKVDVFSSAVVVIQMMFGIHLRGLRDAHSLRSCNDKEDAVSWIKQRFPTWDKYDKVIQLYDDGLFDLLKSMLSFDPDERPSCRQILQHPALLITESPKSSSSS